VPTIDRRSGPLAKPESSAGLVDCAIEALRREWREGFQGTRVRLATAKVRRLNAVAVSHETGIRLARIQTRLHEYDQLPSGSRREALTAIADELKALKPLLL
jgi:hypothetical protein